MKEAFTTLFEKRHSGDYDDFVYCDKEKHKIYIQSLGY
jgi:hypothetical protein